MGFDLATQLSQLVHSPEPQKAALHCLDYPKWSILEVQFNPQSLSLARQANWATGNEALAPWTSLSYTGGAPDTLGFTLLLDQSVYQSESMAGSAAQAVLPDSGGVAVDLLADQLGLENTNSVTAQLADLYRLTLPVQTTTGNAGGRMRPPVLVFVWGDLQFTGVMESVSFELTLFDVDGRPRRATAACSLKGRALQIGATVDDFFGVAYEGPRASAVWVGPTLDPTADPRIDILSRLKG